jgi:hypothetical protein
MELRLATRTFGSAEFAIMTDGAVPGADIAVITADPGVVERLRTDRTGHAVAVAPDSVEQAAACVRAGADLLMGDAFAEVAAATGAALACSSPEIGAAVRPDGLLVMAADLADAERLAGSGVAVLADAPAQAVTAVYAWLGARVLRTSDVHNTRQVLDMVASIRGIRAPAVARRGLA